MLTDAQKKAAKMINDGERVGEVAQAVGVHRVTLWRWRKTKEFKRELKRLAYNDERRLQRAMAKFQKKYEQYWQKRMEEAEEKLEEACNKMRQSETKKNMRAIEKAWDERTIAGLMGYTLDEAEDIITGRKPMKIKLPWLKKSATKTR